MKQTIQGKISELKEMHQITIKNANQLWRETIIEAEGIGSTLSCLEQLEALENGGATEYSLLTHPVSEYEATLAKLLAIEDKYDSLIVQINSSIKKQVAIDQELAQQLRGM